ncbi:SMP-30/gluconolactonase/LRE family protein [Gilvimarinus sp. SDUM040013]|uniref:SMP-30/gluconolactonase/LRE family protein n=1 Tax=Gilvimarinus gilvus TaxID=3058038 RepID=A0ABU4RU25_9GAMM|nr:SMP-30/gluconolactonase/LRE family protein [Gilvimarinus sp. SDUM040013]MDO3385000.1 SMP-30/gluconolactonase/LRE family protein [Gilvimarinus sp. SDUM040013]MDX6848375.1 SMP-30/gluconolactonase/LRE family protein [Gilvimarinus sp. SDUM040013]
MSLKKLSVLVLPFLAVSACAQHNDMPQTAAVCSVKSGAAPQGQLRPERIQIANNAAVGLYEGPVWKDGVLYFSHFLFTDGFPSKVMAYDGDTLKVAIDDSGSNGLALDQTGALIAGTHKYKAVSRLDVGSGERTALAEEFAGNVFNSPNDLTVSRAGTLYFTDPDFQTRAAPGGQPVTGVYEVSDGQVRLIDKTIANPNGISLSPDEATLYVAGGGNHGYVRAYDLTTDFPYVQSQFLAPVTVPDGMAVDCMGNVYVTEHTTRRLRVISPEGEEIASADFDANVTNAAFGGEDMKTLFITGKGSLWKIDMDIAGMPY